MIVLYGPGLVFVRTRKTAGTSIEIALSLHATGGDIVTALAPRDEHLRAQYGGRPPQNHRAPGHQAAGHAPAAGAAAEAPGPRPGIRFYNHMPAADIRAELGAAAWGRLTTVAVDRDPYDKVVSRFFHLHRETPRTHSLPECVAAGHCLDVLNRPLYTGPAGNIIVDQLLRWENLHSGLDALTAQVGLPRLRLPRAKAQFRPPATPYRALLGPAERARIDQVFATEFATGTYR